MGTKRPQIPEAINKKSLFCSNAPLLVGWGLDSALPQLRLWLTLRPLAGTLPVAWAEGKIALESLALALLCFIQEGAHVTLLATHWLVLDPCSLPTTREPGSATLLHAQKVESHKYLVNYANDNHKALHTGVLLRALGLITDVSYSGQVA